MVNLVTVSEYCECAPTEHWGVERLKIPRSESIYKLARVVELAKEHLNAEDLEVVIPWTRNSISDATRLHASYCEEFDTDAHFVAMLLTELETKGEYIDSEWCCNDKKLVAACDAYRLTRAERAHNGKVYVMEYYLKFAIAKSGNVILTVSNKI